MLKCVEYAAPDFILQQSPNLFGIKKMKARSE